MAIVRSLEADPFFTMYSVVDERSAAYFAIGVSLANKEPVALTCTSAQATRNYIPGLTEAFYRKTPIVALTADYAESMIGQGIMQTLDQVSMPPDTHKVAVRLPVVQSRDDEWYCTRLVNEALLGLTHQGGGPVQIDIPIEEHWEGGVKNLPMARRIERHTAWDRGLPSIEANRVMIAIGEHDPFTSEQVAAIEAFAEAYGAVVYTNHLSNYHGQSAVNGSLVILNTGGAEAYSPDLVITIGEQIGSYEIDGFLRASTPEHWRVSLDGRVQDTYQTLTRVFELPEEEFFAAYAELASAEPQLGYRQIWAKANAQRVIPDELPLSHAFVAATMSPKIPADSIMHFAILNAFRNWSFFNLDPSIESYSNVAAYGIDGCLSTFIGHSVATERMAFLVIGDLSFFYDMNAIGIRHVKNNARVVLVNNNGGGEFRLYSNAADKFFGESANMHIAAAGHNGAARAWVESMGWDYIEIRSKQDLLENIDRFVSDNDRPIMMEVFTTMESDSDGVRIVSEANTHETLESRVKKLVPTSMKKSIPPSVRRAAKRILGR